MSASIREIVNAALTVVGEVTGPGVQMYEDDRMKADAIRAFNMMFKKYTWRQYTKWFTITLNGSTGKPLASPFEQVKDFEDFVAVHNDKDPNPLPILPARVNPATLNTGSTRGRYWSSLDVTDSDYLRKKIQIYPFSSIGDMNVQAKVYPLVPPKTQFDWDHTFYLDTDMLVYATAFMTLSGDDLNAGAADTVRNLMEMKYKDVMSALASHPIPVSGDSSIPFHWQER